MNRHWPTRLANGACLTSAVLWLLSLFAAGLSIRLNPWDHHMTLAADFHVGVWSGFSRVDPVLGLCFSDPVLVFFNHNEGPYAGSLTTIEGDPHAPVVTRGDWEFPRIYYRHIQYETAAEWTLMVSLWYPLMYFSIGPVIWGVMRWRRGRANHELNPEPPTGNP